VRAWDHLLAELGQRHLAIRYSPGSNVVVDMWRVNTALVLSRIGLPYSAFRRPRLAAMQDINPLVNLIGDLKGRLTSLRGYL